MKSQKRFSMRMPQAWRWSTVCLVLSGFVPAYAQYFKPFTSGSLKLFMEDAIPADGMSWAFDSAYAEGGDSVFVHFGALNTGSTLIDSLCSGWGSPYCYKTDLPLWSGTLFRTDNAGRYTLRTLNNDTLDFNLNVPPGIPQVFYQDDIQVFSFTKLGIDTMTVLGALDSVFIYAIAHTDTDGVAISSALDQATIVVGKELGLVRFFQVDSFPAVLKPLHLIGNKSPDLGFHRITRAMVHDHQPGDVVQTRSVAFGGYPPLPASYSTVTYLSRGETADSLIYGYDWMYFTTSGSWTNGYGTKAYSKHEVLAELPFTRFDGTFWTLRLEQSTWCPMPLWVLHWERATALGPCPYGNCWIDTDTQGPPPDESGSHILGGTTTRYYYDPPLGMLELPYWEMHSIVYMLKNGVECGHEEHVGMDELSAPSAVSIAPNPTNGPVHVRTADEAKSVAVTDAAGRTVFSMVVNGAEVLLDMSTVAPGIYIARVDLRSGVIVQRTIVVSD